MTKKSDTSITSANTNTENIAVISTKIDYMREDIVGIQGDVKDIKNQLQSDYATKEWCIAEYGQTKKLVNGVVGFILLAVLGAIVALVVSKQ